MFERRISITGDDIQLHFSIAIAWRERFGSDGIRGKAVILFDSLREPLAILGLSPRTCVIRKLYRYTISPAAASSPLTE